jgi:predicted ABC-type ATPase
LSDRIDHSATVTPDTPRTERLTADSLRERLKRLPANHPSSPDRTDNQTRAIEPLSDHEYAEHVRDVREKVAKAQADGRATDKQYTVDADKEIWTEAREAIHQEIIKDLYERAADIPTDHQAIIAGGLPGAGKSTILGRYKSDDRSTFMRVDPDQVKEEIAKRGLIPTIEGLSPMEASNLVHEESSHIAKRLARKAQADGKNVIWDVTMSARHTIERRVENLRAAGYEDIEGLFVDIPPEVSEERAAARHRRATDDYRAGKGFGGRLVPPEIIRGHADHEWGSLNRRNFEAVKHLFDRWAVYDNSVDGRKPVLMDSSDLRIHDDE